MSRRARLSDAIEARLAGLPHAGHLAADRAGFATGAAEDEAHAARVRIQIHAADRARIDDARFLAFGCPSVIACASWVAEHSVGGPLMAPTAARVAADLALDPERAYAAQLAVRALEAAIADWDSRQKALGILGAGD